MKKSPTATGAVVTVKVKLGVGKGVGLGVGVGVGVGTGAETVNPAVSTSLSSRASTLASYKPFLLTSTIISYSPAARVAKV